MWHTIFRDYLDMRKQQAESISALRSISFMIAALGIARALLYGVPPHKEARPIEDKVPWWLGPEVPGTDIPAWVILFSLTSVLVVLSVVTMFKVKIALIVDGTMWMTWGSTWVVGSFIVPDGPWFGSGINAIFVGAICFGLARAWRAEGVD